MQITMNRFVKLTLRGFVVLSLIVITVLVFAVYQNNETTTTPTKTELQLSLQNAVEWLYINEQTIMHNHNTALWWILKESADISDNKRLKAFYQKYKSNYLDKMPDNLWTSFFNPYYKPHVPDIIELMIFRDYQILFLGYSGKFVGKNIADL